MQTENTFKKEFEIVMQCPMCGEEPKPIDMDMDFCRVCMDHTVFEYATEDGEIFDSEEKAQAHQAELDQAKEWRTEAEIEADKKEDAAIWMEEANREERFDLFEELGKALRPDYTLTVKPF